MKTSQFIHWYEGLQLTYTEHPTYYLFRIYHQATDYMRSQEATLVLPRTAMGGVATDRQGIRVDFSDSVEAWELPRLQFMLDFLSTIKSCTHYFMKSDDTTRSRLFEVEIDKRKHLWENPKDKEARWTSYYEAALNQEQMKRL